MPILLLTMSTVNQLFILSIICQKYQIFVAAFFCQIFQVAQGLSVLICTKELESKNFLYQLNQNLRKNAQVKISSNKK